MTCTVQLWNSATAFIGNSNFHSLNHHQFAGFPLNLSSKLSLLGVVKWIQIWNNPKFSLGDKFCCKRSLFRLAKKIQTDRQTGKETFLKMKNAKKHFWTRASNAFEIRRYLKKVWTALFICWFVHFCYCFIHILCI